MSQPNAAAVSTEGQEHHQIFRGGYSLFRGHNQRPAEKDSWILYSRTALGTAA